MINFAYLDKVIHLYLLLFRQKNVWMTTDFSPIKDNNTVKSRTNKQDKLLRLSTTNAAYKPAVIGLNKYCNLGANFSS